MGNDKRIMKTRIKREIEAHDLGILGRMLSPKEKKEQENIENVTTFFLLAGAIILAIISLNIL